MRLELEPLTTTYVASRIGMPPVEEIIQRGVTAARDGNRSEARILLQQAVELDSNSEAGWLWLASISEYPEELLVFLDHVLRINPNNRRAIEWKDATRTLLAKTFVQRGIEAANDAQTDYALHCFQEALKYDEQNQMAWYWVATIKDNAAATEIAPESDPDTTDEAVALRPEELPMTEQWLDEAKSAADSGDTPRALQLLEQIIEADPYNNHAWIFRAHLAETLEEKLSIYERVLEFDPENLIAQAGYESLSSILTTTEPKSDLRESEYQVLHNEPMVLRSMMAAEPHDGPTQELELPASMLESNPFESFAEDLPVPETDTIFQFAESESTAPEVFAYEDLAAVPVFETHGVFDSVWDGSAASQPIEIRDDDSENLVPADEPVKTEASEFDSEVPERLTFAEPEMPTLTQNAQFSFGNEAICPFCSSGISDPAILCGSCGAILTMSDIDAVLLNRVPVPSQLQVAIDRMETFRRSGELNSDSLVDLALGHLNLKDINSAYSCLQEASAMSPNNVLISSQLNTLAIRLEENQKRAKRPTISGRKTVLVVDDSATVRKLIAGKLEKGGHEVFCAEDGVQAIELLQHLRPDLILLDIAMPRMDGYQACKHIRSTPATSNVPIIMISGKDGFFDKMRGKMAGCTDYITKPFGPEALMRSLGTYLQDAEELAGIQ